MERRKIQLIANMTYVVSLPKPWVSKNSLEGGNSLVITENDDGTLLLSKDIVSVAQREKISITVDDYADTIESILIKLYYLGFEKIELHSKPLKKEMKNKIRSTLPFLIGTEITHEDENKIVLRVLLDKSKVDVIQSLFRMSLVLGQMISSILEEIDMKDMELNENETDRLYHLITKMLSLSITDSNVLVSSKIQHVSFITHYMLIAKRFEIIGDNIYWLGKYLVESKKKLALEHKRKVADFLKQEIARTIKCIMADYPSVFSLPNDIEIRKIQSYIDMIKDGKIKEHLSYSTKLVLDNEDEVVSISFSKKLMRDKFI